MAIRASQEVHQWLKDRGMVPKLKISRSGPNKLDQSRKRPRSHLEKAFARTWERCGDGHPAPVREYTFAPPRRFRFDFAWPQYKVAVEIEGGIYGKGGHNSINGFIKDCEKYNRAVIAGWRVLRYTERCLTKRPVQVVEEIIAALKAA